MRWLHIALVATLVGSLVVPPRVSSAFSYAGGNDVSIGRSADSAGSSRGATGGASWSYPLSLPPGRDGFTPSLGFNYASDGGNSWVGRGWSFGVPAIERDTSLGVPKYEPSDRFILSGVGLTHPQA